MSKKDSKTISTNRFDDEYGDVISDMEGARCDLEVAAKAFEARIYNRSDFNSYDYAGAVIGMRTAALKLVTALDDVLLHPEDGIAENFPEMKKLIKITLMSSIKKISEATKRENRRDTESEIISLIKFQEREIAKLERKLAESKSELAKAA